MRKSFLILAFLAFASLISAQTDSNSVTVTASRTTTTTFQIDQASFGITVTSDLNTSLDDVLAALQGSGITIANFSGLYNFPYGYPPTPSAPPSMLQWSFGLVVQLSKIKDTFASLTTLQQNLVKKNNGLSITFAIQGSQPSGAGQQSQCSLTDLISDARAKAQKMVDAAGLGLGVVLAMSSSTSVAPANIQPYAIPLSNFCSLTVKFALQRF